MAEALAKLESVDVAGPSGARRSGTIRLCAWLIALGTLWLVALPALSRREPIASELEWLDQQGVDPSAMYYTELEVMKPILQRLNQRERSTQRRR